MLSVLYVDDEPGLLEIGKLYLENFGDFSVSTVQSAPAALGQLGRGHFDAVISDYQMPGMDGLELLTQVRLRNGNLPFILFTGRGREEVVIRALNLGADFYLQKGGDPQAQFAELSHKIRQAVGRRRMEVALEESESRYRAVIESQTELICRFRPDGTLLFVNGAFCTYYGESMDALLGRPFRPRLPPAERAGIRQHLCSLTYESPVGTMEHRVLAPDGSIRWQQWTDRAIFNEDGQVAEFQSVGRDITDRKRAEEELRAAYEQLTASQAELRHQYDELARAERELRLLKISVDRSADEIFWMDFSGNFLYVNDAACRVNGYTREEFLGMTIYALNPDLTPEIWAWTTADLREKKTQLFTTRHRHRDGSVIDVEILAVYVLQEGEEYSFTFVRDITERKRAETAVFESERKYRTLVETANEGIWTIDAEFRTTFANRKMQELFGYSLEEMLGRPVWDFVPAEDVESMKHALLIRRTGVPGRYERRWVRKDKTIIWCYTSATPLFSPRGEFTGSFGMFTDITGRRRTDEALRESEEKYRTLVGSSFDGIAIHQDGIFVYVNEPAAGILGTGDPGAVVGTPVHDIIPPELRDRTGREITAVPSRPRRNLRQKFRRPDGTAIDVDVTITAGIWMGKPAGFVTFRPAAGQGGVQPAGMPDGDSASRPAGERQ